MEIRRRWDRPEMAGVREAVIEALHTGRSIADVGLDVVEGRLDLRGISLSGEDGTPQGWTFLHNVHLRGVDLTHGTLKGFVFRDGRFDDVVFDRAQLRVVSFVESSVAGCSFDGAKLSDGAFNHARVEATSLRGARLQRYLVVMSDFVDCSFVENTWTRTEPRDSSFVRCDFSGAVLKTAQFTGSGDREVSFAGSDFRTARFDDVAFKFVDPTGVRWPEDDRILVVEPYVDTLREAIRLLEGDDSPVAERVRREFTDEIRWAGGAQDTGFLSIHIKETHGVPGDAEFCRQLIARAQDSLATSAT